MPFSKDAMKEPETAAPRTIEEKSSIFDRKEKDTGIVHEVKNLYAILRKSGR